MRKLIIAMGALAAAAPAAAQPRHDPRDDAIARRLPPPGEIERVGETVARVSDALMDVDIGPIVDAVEGRRYGRRGPETIGDLATRDDPYARERIHDTARAATVGIAAAADQIAIMTPTLRAVFEDAARRMEDAMRTPRYDRRYDRRDEDRDEDDRGPR
ncbi:MAG TPA: hypothetical protein VHM92_06115 [Allosphingosinicella sp.]|nr:hypothetical protein [Allosphingosinicella sp.]